MIEITDAELKRELVRKALRVYRDQSISPVTWLEGINDAASGEEFKEGQPISVSANGQTVTVSLPYPRAQLLKVSGQALDYVELQTDPLAPALPTVMRRARMSFSTSTIS